jgi:hypothetical protein
VEPTTAGLACILTAISAFGVAGVTGLVGAKQPPLPAYRREAVPRSRAALSSRWQAADALPARLASRRHERVMPAGPPSPDAARPAPGDAVAAYYAALDARRFRVAWRALSATVQHAFGGFAAWRGGFATTHTSRPRALRVTRSGDTAAVSLVLDAADRASCGTMRHSFAVRWQLSWDGARWTARAVTARATGAPSCSS